jgi:hypothetical protein
MKNKKNTKKEKEIKHKPLIEKPLCELGEKERLLLLFAIEKISNERFLEIIKGERK